MYKNSLARAPRAHRSLMLAGAIAISLSGGMVEAQTRAPAAEAQIQFDIPEQPAGEALNAFARQSGWRILFPYDEVEGKRTRAIKGVMSAEAALQALLQDTGLEMVSRKNGVITLCAERDGRCAYPAQDVPADDVSASAPAGGAQPTNLGSLVVTARRREERQLDVPIAMATVTGEDMDRYGMKNVADAINATAGASSSAGVQIRGISTSLGGNENGYYVNETPFTGVSTPWYPDVRSFDIDRVEVLKGPQGTLFGEGSMGGTVRIFTRKPEFDRFAFGVEMDASKTSGGTDGNGIKAYANVPLVDDRLALRVVATDEKIAGWMDDRASGRSNVNGSDIRTHRLALRFQPMAQWTIDAMYWKYKTTSDAIGSYLYDDLSYNAFSQGETEWDSGSLSSTYDFGGSQLVYTYSRGTITMAQFGELAPGAGYDYVTSVRVRTNELRWASSGERRFDWTVGAYLRKASRADVLDVPLYALHSNSVQDNSGYALFGEANLDLSPQWSLTAGLRYFSDDVDAIEATGTGAVGGLDARFDSWNPRMSLSYKPSDDTTLYASAARGFRSGQLQPISTLQLAEIHGISLPSQISPDSIWTYEIGAKSMFLDSRLLLEGAIYQSEWKDVAVRVPIENLFSGLINSAGTTTRGIEASAAYSPNRDLTLQLGVSYVDSQYREDVPGTTFRRGMQAYHVPRFSASSQVGYGWDVGKQLRGVASFTARHESARLTPILDGGSAGDAITELSAKVGLESPVGWAAYLYVRNLTNENGAVSARDPDLVDADGMLQERGAATRLVPRTVGVLFRYDY